MQYSSLIGVFAFLASTCLMPLSAKVSNPSFASVVPTVAYCDLIRNPKLYCDKLIRIRVLYRYGYEWSQFYCPECLSEGETWVDFEKSFKSCTRSEVSRRIGDNGFKGRTVELLVVGKFYGSDVGYGHMNAYRFKFVVSCVEAAKIMLNDSPLPTALPKKLLNRPRC